MKRAIREFAIMQKPPACYQGRVLREGEVYRVRVMARAEGWAMVRRKGSLPFVTEDRFLSPTAESPR